MGNSSRKLKNPQKFFAFLRTVAESKGLGGLAIKNKDLGNFLENHSSKVSDFCLMVYSAFKYDVELYVH